MFSIRHVCIMGIVLLTVGCGGPPAAPKARVRPAVKVVDVKKRTIVRIADQPGFIEAYEQTSLYARVSGFIDQWSADIGDVIKAGQLLAHIDVPDLVAEYDEKKAEVELADVRVKVAQEMVEVSRQNWKNAIAKVKEAKANLGKYIADVEFRKADYKRIKALYDMNSVAAPVLDTKRKDLESSVAFKEAADAGVVVAESTEAARKADLDKAQVDVTAAQAQAKVARETQKRYAALVSYTQIKAPYNGTVVARNVNTGDFVQPARGDLSGPRSIQDNSRSRSDPLYIVARTDKVRIFLDVPETDAPGVHIGNKAWVNIEALDNLEISSQVTRTSWSLSTRSRTLRAEIDIPNKGQRILPNMYAFGKVEIKRTDVWAVPLAALVELGNQTSCYEVHDGKAMVLPVQRGMDDGHWVEVVRKNVQGAWVPFDGTERIVVGELAQISDGEPVREGEAKK